MPDFDRRGKRIRVRVMVRGRRVSATFDTKTQAAAWALEQTAQLRGEKLPAHTVVEALRRYAREVSPTKAGERWEVVRLRRLETDPLARGALSALTPDDVVAYRNRRLQAVSGASVRREMNLLGSVFKQVVDEWHWLAVSPMKGVKRPASPRSRRRRISADEVKAIANALGVGGKLKAATVKQRTGLAFLFALETAMRAGEILALTADNVHLAECYVHIPTSKNGEGRDVPLTRRARAILKALPGNVFDLNESTRDVIFRAARDRAGVQNLHFHDARAEAIWRLSRKLNVLELARVTGHRDLKSLLFYYETSAKDLARRL